MSREKNTKYVTMVTQLRLKLINKKKIENKDDFNNK
jgi:hypothetical protein